MQPDLSVVHSFPFKKEYTTRRHDRGWTKFIVREQHSARVSSYTEHLCYKNSFELATIIGILLRTKKMSVEFFKTQCTDILQRDLNPKKVKHLTNDALISNLESAKVVVVVVVMLLLLCCLHCCVTSVFVVGSVLDVFVVGGVLDVVVVVVNVLDLCSRTL